MRNIATTVYGSRRKRHHRPQTLGPSSARVDTTPGASAIRRQLAVRCAAQKQVRFNAHTINAVSLAHYFAKGDSSGDATCLSNTTAERGLQQSASRLTPLDRILSYLPVVQSGTFSTLMADAKRRDSFFYISKSSALTCITLSLLLSCL